MIKNIIIVALLVIIAYPAFAGMKAVAVSSFGLSVNVENSITKIPTETGGGIQ